LSTLHLSPPAFPEPPWLRPSHTRTSLPWRSDERAGGPRCCFCCCCCGWRPPCRTPPPRCEQRTTASQTTRGTPEHRNTRTPERLPYPHESPVSPESPARVRRGGGWHRDTDGLMSEGF
jgi:hypothetical protein